MTLFECIKSYLSASSTLAAKLPGGFHPGRIPQKRTVGSALCVFRVISGASLPPTHDNGASPWSKVRIELTFWGDDYKTMEQAAIIARGLFGPFNGHMVASGSHGRFATSEVQGPRDLTDAETKLAGIQMDVLGLLDGSTLS